jgi:hypothetical protein
LIAQTGNEGVYLSANDFTNGKVSYGHNNTNNKYEFHLHEISFKTPIKIILDNTIVKLNKDSVYGYRDKKNTCYRYFNKGIFKILNPSEKFLLYSNSSVEDGPRNIHRVRNYFFSADATSPIYLLTKWNLKIVLFKDIYFHELLDVYFQGDDELTAYDEINKIYLLNSVYEMSKQSISKMLNN